MARSLVPQASPMMFGTGTAGRAALPRAAMLVPTSRIFASMPDMLIPEQLNDTTAEHWQRPSVLLDFESNTETSREPRIQTRFKRLKRVASNLLKIGAPERSRTPNPQIRS